MIHVYFKDVKLFDVWIGEEQLKSDGVGEIELKPATTAIGLRGEVYPVPAVIKVLYRAPDDKRLVYWYLDEPHPGQNNYNPGWAMSVETSDPRIKLKHTK